MARYRTLNNDTAINVDGVRLRAGDDGVFDVTSGSRSEAVLLAGGAVLADGQGFTAAEVAAGKALVSAPGIQALADNAAALLALIGVSIGGSTYYVGDYVAAGYVV